MATADDLRAYFDLADQLIADASKENPAEAARLLSLRLLRGVPFSAHREPCEALTTITFPEPSTGYPRPPHAAWGVLGHAA